MDHAATCPWPHNWQLVTASIPISTLHCLLPRDACMWPWSSCSKALVRFVAGWQPAHLQCAEGRCSYVIHEPGEPSPPSGQWPFLSSPKVSSCPLPIPATTNLLSGTIEFHFSGLDSPQEPRGERGKGILQSWNNDTEQDDLVRKVAVRIQCPALCSSTPQGLYQSLLLPQAASVAEPLS